MRSEIPIRNLYYMLAYAYRALQKQNYASLETEPFETASDLLAAILVKEISQQLRQGLSICSCSQYHRDSDWKYRRHGRSYHCRCLRR